MLVVRHINDSDLLTKKVTEPIYIIIYLSMWHTMNTLQYKIKLQVGRLFKVNIHLNLYLGFLLTLESRNHFKS